MPIGRLQTEGELEAFIRDAIDRHDLGVLLRSAQARADALEARVAELETAYRARVYNSAAIATVSGAALLTLTFNSERYDEGGLHSTAVNTGRLTAPVAGKYSVGASVRWASNAVGYRQLSLARSGTTSIARQLGPAASGTVTYQSVQTEIELAAGDWIEVQVQQNSGGNLNIEANVESSPEFWMALIR